MKIAAADTGSNADNAADEHWKPAARQLEAEGENAAAVKMYEAVLKRFPQDAYIYDRLMILYRKEKDYKKELALITTAIDKFSALLGPHKKTSSRKIASLSASILHAVGLVDKKGSTLYYPQPIARWMKRKSTVQQRLKKKN